MSTNLDARDARLRELADAIRRAAAAESAILTDAELDHLEAAARLLAQIPDLDR